MATPDENPKNEDAQGPEVAVEETPVTEGPQQETIEGPAEPSEDSSEESETPEKAEKTPDKEELPEDVKKLSPKAQDRYRDLAKKGSEAEARAKAAEEELETLRQELGDEFTGSVKPKLGADSFSQQPPKLPWESDLESGQPKELSVDDYKRDVVQTADWLVKARLGQVEKANEVQRDLDRLQGKYEVLNPESEGFDKELSTKLAGLFRKQIQADPSSNLYSFVDSIMEVRSKGKEEGQAETTAVLAQQKSEEALTPAESDLEQEETKFEDLSLDEQEKWLKDRGLWES